jgi:acyl carrier protein
MPEEFSAILRRHLRYLPPDKPLAPDAPLRDLGLDSMAAVTLMLDLEDEFGITLPDSELTRNTFATPAALWAAVDAAAGLSRG